MLQNTLPVGFGCVGLSHKAQFAGGGGDVGGGVVDAGSGVVWVGLTKVQPFDSVAPHSVTAPLASL